MAKKTTEFDKSVINLAIPIKRHVVDADLLREFAGAKLAKNSIAQGSLTEYIEKAYYNDKNVVVVPDLSNQHFESMDLNNLDFTGCKLSGANFQFCNLRKAIFADCDLSSVMFNDCQMQKADMRGADLSGCEFGMVGEGWDKTIEETRAKFKNMKFSTTEGLLAGYLEKNNQIRAEAEQDFDRRKAEKLEGLQKKIDDKQNEINIAYKGLSWVQSGYLATGQASGNEKYDNFLKDRQKLEAEKAKIASEFYFAGNTKYVVSPSLIHVMGGQKNFDPAYIRGSNKQEREQEKQYVRLTRGDVENYLKDLRDNPELGINDFAKSLMSKKGMKEVTDAKIVADLSSRKLENGRIERVDLSGLDFTGANLQKACFSGANMKDCNFTKANLNKAIFESANISGAKFVNTKALDANFFYCDMASASITAGSDFRRAFMRGSDGTKASIKDSNFNYANIKHGKWDDVTLSDTQLKYADLEGISLARADLRRVDMQYAMLDKAIMDNVSMVSVDLQGSMMNDVVATNAKIKDSVLKGIEARNIDLTDAELDKFCNLQEADLRKAILERVSADGVNFQKAKLDEANMAFASLKEANLEKVSARFASLENAVIDGCKASEMDISGADLSHIHATKADFSKVIARDMVATDAIFDDSVMEAMDARGANLSNALMERVNLRKADLRGADLQKGNLKDSDLSAMKIDEGTSLAGAKVENVKGKLEHHSLQGEVHSMDVTDKVKNDEQVQAAKQKNKTLAGIGNALKGIGGFVNKSGDYIRQPFGPKWGRIIGAAVGAVVLGGIAASIVFTGGASLIVGAGLLTIAGVVGGAGVVGAGIGAVSGHYASKKMTMLDVAAGTAGAFMGGAVGAGIAVAAAKGVDGMAKSATGKTVTESLASAAENLGEGLQRAGGQLGLSEKEQASLDAHNQAKATHKAENIVSLAQESGVDKNRKEAHKDALQQRAKQEERGLVQDVSKKHEIHKKPENPIDQAKDIGKKQKEAEELTKKRLDDGQNKGKKIKKDKNKNKKIDKSIS